MAEFKLSLIQRKNLKDNEEKLQENLQTIKDATGKDDWALEIDWGVCYPVLQLADRPGSTIYDECLKALAGNITNLCKDEHAKASFVEATSGSKIIFTVDKKATGYWSEKIVNGNLEIGWKGSVCNVYQIGQKIEEQLTCVFEEVTMPVILRKNIAANEEKKEELLQKIQEATGREFTLTVVWGDMIKDHMGTYASSFGGQMYSDCLGGLAENIKKVCSTEFGKDAFNEFASTGKIIFNSNKNDKKATAYFTEKFENGDLVVSYKSVCNTYQIGGKIEEQLTCVFEEVTMPVLLRKNIAEKEEKKEEHLEKIRNATGRDFTLQVVWADMIKDHMGTYTTSFGGSMIDDCLGGLAENIRKLCTNEVFPGKDAFNEKATSGNIIFNSNKNDKKVTAYFTVAITNGDLVVSYKSVCNTYQIGQNLEEFLTVEFEEVTMPYVMRRSIAASEEKFQEHMTKINEATGRQFEVSIAWPKMLPFLKDVNKTQNSQVGSTLYESVMEGLSTNIKKLCAEEMGKEAFNELASTGKIVLTTWDDKKASGYWNEKFENGDVVISFKSICNCYQIGSSLEKLL